MRRYVVNEERYAATKPAQNVFSDETNGWAAFGTIAKRSIAINSNTESPLPSGSRSLPKRQRGNMAQQRSAEPYPQSHDRHAVPRAAPSSWGAAKMGKIWC